MAFEEEEEDIIKGTSVPEKPYGFCRRKVAFEGEEEEEDIIKGTSVPDKPYGFCRRKGTFEKEEEGEEDDEDIIDVAVLGSPSLISLMVSVDAKEHLKKKKKKKMMIRRHHQRYIRP